MSLDDFKAEFASNGNVDRSKLNFFTNLADDPEEKILIYYAEDKNVGIKAMRSFISILEEKGIQRGILIWSEKMTAAARKVIDAMRMQFKLEDFEEAYLLVNITHHQLVPEHKVMTQEEKKELLQRYRLKETQLPRIQINDPVARYFGLSRGQVVKITRRELQEERAASTCRPVTRFPGSPCSLLLPLYQTASETSGRYCSYRICI